MFARASLSSSALRAVGCNQFDLARCKHFGLVQRVREWSAQAQFTIFWPPIGASGSVSIRQGFSSVQPQIRHFPASNSRRFWAFARAKVVSKWANLTSTAAALNEKRQYGAVTAIMRKYGNQAQREPL